MKYDIKLFGMHKRDAMIANLAKELDLSYETDIFYDERPNGGPMMDTAAKAWLAPMEYDITHRLVIQDDIEVVEGFKDLLQQMIDAHPDKALMLFPFEYSYNIFQANAWIERGGTPYVYTKMISAPAMCIPRDWIKSWWDYVYSRRDQMTKEAAEDWWKKAADDGTLGEWLMLNLKYPITAIPALVQHIGDDSIVTPGISIRRTNYFFKKPKPMNWGSSDINPIPKCVPQPNGFKYVDNNVFFN